MRVHRLRLERVKGVQACELTFPETGVVVIEGPNEVGKSTLLEALDRLLDPKAKVSSKAASITSLQPVGQDVGPYVEAELTIGTYRLIFAKQWLKQPATTLQILQPSPEQLTGQDAQARMNAIVDECLDRTLFDALRLSQAGAPGAIELGNSAVLEAALDAAAGAALHADEGSALLEAVELEYQRYFTAGTGRVSGELRHALAAVTEAEHRHEQAQHEVHEVEQMFARRDALTQQMLTSDRVVSEASAATRAADAELARVSALRVQEQVELTASEAAEQSHRRALTGLHSRRALVDEVLARSAEVALRHVEAQQLQAGRDQRVDELALLEVELERATAACVRAQEEAEASAALVSRLQAEDEVETLFGRIATAERIARELEQSNAEVEASALSREVLEGLRASVSEVNIAQAQMDASATVVRLWAADAGHRVDIDESPHELVPGADPVERGISSDVSLLVDGRVRIEIRPDVQARERVEDREASRAALAGRLAQAGVSDLAEAEVAAQRRAGAVSRTAQLEHELAQALQGQELEALRETHAAQAASLESVSAPRGTATHPADQSPQAPQTPQAPHAPQEQSGDAGDARDAGRDRSMALRQAQHRADEARRPLPACHYAREQAQHSVDAVRDLCSRSGRDLDVMVARHSSAWAECERVEASLADARATESDEDVERYCQDTELALGATREALRDVRAALAAEGALTREAEASRAAAEHERATERQQVVREQFFEAKGRLEQVTAEGRQEAYERADQALDDARRKHASVERRAIAARNLHSTLQRHRDRAHESYAEPYAREIERLGQQIYGQSFGVSVSPGLVITHRRLHGDTVPFDSLSGGAQEQLGIVARLAVAAMVAGSQSVPVVIDDALGYTDPQRLQRLGAVLGQGGGGGQILLLTCTPDRYASIPGAHTIRMTA